MSKSSQIQFKSSQEIDGKQSLLLIDLTKFYCHEKNIVKFKNIVENKSKISLRLIDWFVTNFSKKNQTMYPLREFKDKEENEKNNCDNLSKVNKNTDNKEYNKEPIMFSDYFCVFSNYKGQLKSYHKRNFDPFCRNIRIHFYYDNNNFIITTVGQLNFFKWAIENNILNYIEQNLKIIEEDMNLIANIKNKSGTSKSCKKKTNITEKNKTVKNNNNINNEINKLDNNNTVDNINNTIVHTNTDKVDDITNNVNNTIDDTINNIVDNNNKNKNKISKPNKKIVVQKNNTQKKTINTEGKGTTRRKRRELSESASKSLIKHNCKTVITFD